MFGNTKEQRTVTSTPNPVQTHSSSRGNHNDAITAYLGPDTKIEGTLRFENSVLIEGKFNGKIESEHGTLVIGESADVEADITGGNITVRGKVKGSITATQRVHLQDRGQFSGELTTPSLQMDESVTFDGSCKMPRPGQNQGSGNKNQNQNQNKKSEQDRILEAVDSVKS